MLNVAVRFGLYIALAAAFGIPLFALYSPTLRDVLPLRATVVAAGIAGLVLSAFGLLAAIAAMSGTDVTEIDAGNVLAVLTGMSLGLAWLARIAGLSAAIAAAIVWHDRKSSMLAVASVGGGVAIASLAWSGHGTMDQGWVGWFHLSTDVVHLLAAGAWTGALLSFVSVIARPRSLADAAAISAVHRALDGFGRVGVVIVLAIIVTGVSNTWLVVGAGSVVTLPASIYGRLLIAKLLLFAVMLCLAAANRYRLTPALARSVEGEDWGGAIAALRKSLALETMGVIGILALVAWLGTLEPASTSL